MSAAPLLPHKIPALFPHPEAAFLDLRRIASLIQFIYPELPRTLRFYEVQSDDENISAVRPRFLFTNDVRPKIENGLQDMDAVDLISVLKDEQGLPSRLARGLLTRVEAANEGNLSLSFDAAARSNRVELSQHHSNEAQLTLNYSNPIEPFPLEFLDDPFLAQVGQALFKSHRPHFDIAYEGKESEVYRHLQNIEQIQELLKENNFKWDALRVLNNKINALQPDGEMSYESRTQQGWLAFSILNDSTEVVKLMELNNRNISVYAPYLDITPIMAAVVKRNESVVEKLLESGVSPNVLVKPLPEALISPEYKKVQEKLGGYAPLIVVAAAMAEHNSSSAVVDKLIQSGALLNTKDANGNTALHWAIENGNTAVFKQLLKAGATPFMDAKNNEGLSARQMLTKLSLGQKELFEDALDEVKLSVNVASKPNLPKPGPR